MMASYVPLLAKEGHTQWNTDLIFFNNTEVKPTVNYYVQQLFGQNAGDQDKDTLTDVLLEAQSEGTMTAVSLNKKDSVQTINLGGYKILITLRKNWNGITQAENGYALISNTGMDEFILAGADLNAAFIPDSPGPRIAGLASVYEGEYVNGKWTPGRLLNGDDIMFSYHLAEEAAANRTGTGVRLKSKPGIFQVKLYRFE
jgi:hypothetical protein